MRFETFVNSAPGLGVLGVEVSRGGETVLKENWAPVHRRDVYSITKSVVATAVGIAVSEGLLTLSEKVAEIFTHEMPRPLPPYWEGVAVEDLLTMGLGYDTRCLMAPQRWQQEEENWIRVALSHPMTRPVGKTAFYTNIGPYLAGVLVQRRAGCDLQTYLKPRLFDPLGIRWPNWEKDPLGYNFGGAGLSLALPEMHRLGRLWLNNGRWEGNQLVDAQWLRECARKHTETENGHRYGYLFWLGDHGLWKAEGSYGQMIIMYPEKEAVIAVQSECHRVEELKQLVREGIMDQL